MGQPQYQEAHKGASHGYIVPRRRELDERHESPEHHTALEACSQQDRHNMEYARQVLGSSYQALCLMNSTTAGPASTRHTMPVGNSCSPQLLQRLSAAWTPETVVVGECGAMPAITNNNRLS